MPPQPTGQAGVSPARYRATTSARISSSDIVSRGAGARGAIGKSMSSSLARRRRRKRFGTFSFLGLRPSISARERAFLGGRPRLPGTLAGLPPLPGLPAGASVAVAVSAPGAPAAATTSGAPSWGGANLGGFSAACLGGLGAFTGAVLGAAGALTGATFFTGAGAAAFLTGAALG